MISTEEMKKCEGNRIRVAFEDLDSIEGLCECYLQSEDEEEEPVLELGKYLINQSEIVTITVLDTKEFYGFENIRKEKMYKEICRKIGRDIIDDYLWHKRKEIEYHKIHEWTEDDRPIEEIYREIYGMEYVNLYKDLTCDEIDYIADIYDLRYDKYIRE